MIVLLVIVGIVLIVAIFTIIPRIKNALSKVPFIVYLLIVIALIAATAFLAINVFGPRGEDDLLSRKADGIEQGDAEVNVDLEGDSEDGGTYLSVAQALEGNEAGDDTIYVVIRGDEVKIGETVMEDTGMFRSAISGLAGEGRKICLADDYATAMKYKEIQSAMDELGIQYREETRQ